MMPYANSLLLNSALVHKRTYSQSIKPLLRASSRDVVTVFRVFRLHVKRFWTTKSSHSRHFRLSTLCSTMWKAVLISQIDLVTLANRFTVAWKECTNKH